MIARYSLPEMAAIFTDEARFARYLDIELMVLDAQVDAGAVPPAAAAACRARAPRVDATLVAMIAERERTTDHDVAAFVDIVQAAIGMPDGAWLHHGLTSSDVVDTAWCSMLRDAADIILSAINGLIGELVTLARRHAATPMMGRTHGMHAELTTFGAKVALWALQVDRDRIRLRAARASVAVCKMSGAVGTYSTIDPRVEARVGERLGLVPVPSTQVVARDRHAEYLWACASLGTTIGAIATELRHLQRSEVGEVREGFKPGQKGSSAMPHKRNPISAETLTGISRLLRANAQAGMENVALWHERDISHSSVERVVLPDSSLLAHYAATRLTRLVSSLEVDEARMVATIESSQGLAHSQAVLLALVAAGKPRDEAYRTVQEASARAVAEGRHLCEVLESSTDLPLRPAELTACFDEASALRHARRAVDALDGLV